MFKNSGKKIMGFVKFMYFLNFILAILALIGSVVFAISEYRYDTPLLMATVGVAVLAVIVYMVIVYVALLCLYAFGELVQSNLEMQQTLNQLQMNSHRAMAMRQTPVRAVPRKEEPAIGVSAAPAAPAAPADSFVPPMPAEEPVIQNPADRTPNFAYNYKGAAGAPVFPLPNQNPRPQEPEAPPAPVFKFCSKCGAKHDPSAMACRYCGNIL